jgi:hypothetical protein
MIGNLYDLDYAAWSKCQAELLRQGKLSELDIRNLIEELEGLGSSIRDAIESYLIALLTHLLKWQYQPALRQYTETGEPCGS